MFSEIYFGVTNAESNNIKTHLFYPPRHNLKAHYFKEAKIFLDYQLSRNMELPILHFNKRFEHKPD